MALRKDDRQIYEAFLIFSGAQLLSGRVLDSRLRDVGSSLTGVTALCP